MSNHFRLTREHFEPKESEIRLSIQKYLNMRGIFNFRQWQGQFSVKGVPDLIGVLPGSGRILGIEVKRPGGKIRPEQTEFIEKINRSGGVAFFASSVEEVASKLQIK